MLKRDPFGFYLKFPVFSFIKLFVPFASIPSASRSTIFERRKHKVFWKLSRNTEEQLTERLSTGAVVEELQLAGERLQCLFFD